MGLADAFAQIEHFIPKDARNKHGNYKYTPKDDVYAHVRKALKEAGLVPVADQQSSEVIPIRNKSGQETPVQRDHYLLGFEGIEGREGFFVHQPFTGPQTSGSTRGYAVKYWLINKFLLGDGEEEADGAPPADQPQPDPQPAPALSGFDVRRRSDAVRTYTQALQQKKGWDVGQVHERMEQLYGTVDPKGLTEDQLKDLKQRIAYLETVEVADESS